MANAKQEVLKLLETLPEEASLEDIQYHLYVLQYIGRGQQDIAAGRTLSQDEVERRMARWLDK
jgi:predicted transcriptional regulator